MASLSHSDGSALSPGDIAAIAAQSLPTRIYIDTFLDSANKTVAFPFQNIVV